MSRTRNERIAVSAAAVITIGGALQACSLEGTVEGPMGSEHPSGALAQGVTGACPTGPTGPTGATGATGDCFTPDPEYFYSTAWTFADYIIHNPTPDGADGVACDVTIDGASYSNLNQIPEGTLNAMWGLGETINVDAAQGTTRNVWPELNGARHAQGWGPSKVCQAPGDLSAPVARDKGYVCRFYQALTTAADDNVGSDVPGTYLTVVEQLELLALQLEGNTSDADPDVARCERRAAINSCFGSLSACQASCYGGASGLYLAFTGQTPDCFLGCARANSLCADPTAPDQIREAYGGPIARVMAHTLGAVATPFESIVRCAGSVPTAFVGANTIVEQAYVQNVCHSAALNTGLLLVGGVGGRWAIRALTGGGALWAVRSREQCRAQCATAVDPDACRSDCDEKLAGNIMALGGTLFVAEGGIQAVARRPLWQNYFGSAARTRYLTAPLRWARRLTQRTAPVDTPEVNASAATTPVESSVFSEPYTITEADLLPLTPADGTGTPLGQGCQCQTGVGPANVLEGSCPRGAPASAPEPVWSPFYEALGGRVTEPVRVINSPEMFGGPAEIAVPPETPVFRAQEPGLDLLPHDSPYFNPDRYGLSPWSDWWGVQALYVAADAQSLAWTLRNYPGTVMYQSTLGALVANAKAAGFTNVRVVNDGIFSMGGTPAYIIVGTPPPPPVP